MTVLHENVPLNTKRIGLIFELYKLSNYLILFTLYLVCVYFLLTELEVRAVSYGPSFFDLWP